MKIRAITALAVVTLITVLSGCNTMPAPDHSNSLSYHDICKEQGLCGGGGGH